MGKTNEVTTLGGRMASRSASEACGNLSLAVLLSFFLSAPDKRCMVFTSTGFLNMADQTPGTSWAAYKWVNYDNSITRKTMRYRTAIENWETKYKWWNNQPAWNSSLGGEISKMSKVRLTKCRRWDEKNAIAGSYYHTHSIPNYWFFKRKAVREPNYWFLSINLLKPQTTEYLVVSAYMTQFVQL